MSEEEKDEPSFYKSKHYFNLSDATDDISMADGVKGTTTAFAKFAGKTLFNAGLLAGKTTLFVAKEAIENAPAFAVKMAEQNLRLNGHKMTSDQRERAEEIIREHGNKK